MSTPKTSRQLACEYFDHSIRAEEVIWLGAQCDQYPDALKEMCEDLQDLKYGELDKVFSEGSGRKIKFCRERGFKKHKNGEYDDIDPEVFMGLTIDEGLYGFMVEFATPVPTGFTESGSYSLGFGYYERKWFYTEAFDEALFNRAKKWAESVEAYARKEHTVEKSKP